MKPPIAQLQHLVKPGRLIALIDGVFAVAMTLLVLDLRLPSQIDDLNQALLSLLPAFLIYLLAFALLASYWTIHHSTFHNIEYCDGRLILFSIINLLFVTLYPVTANIVGSHPLEPIATVCLSINSLLYCISAWALWSHAAKNPQLLVLDADINRLKEVAQNMLLVAIGLMIAIPLTFLSVIFAYLFWFLGPPIAAWLSHRKR
jgi:uncharacterized membrane protein